MRLRNIRAVIALLLVLPMLGACVGCGGSSRVGESTAVGAAIGAGVGLLLGAIAGKPGRGLAVGAVMGGGQGAYEGWRQDQDDRRAREIADAVRESRASPPPAADPAARAREELTRFLGVWSMEGFVQEPSGERRSVQAQVNGDVEMGYFVELAWIDLRITGIESEIWGTTTLGFDPGVGYTLVSRFNTTPEIFRVVGTFDASSRTFRFEAPPEKVIVRFESPDRFTSETLLRSGGRDVTVESFRFTRR